MTVRRQGESQSSRLASGSPSIDSSPSPAVNGGRQPRSATRAHRGGRGHAASGDAHRTEAVAPPSEVARLEHAFEAALAERSAAGAAEAILHLDRAIQEWATDTLQTDDPDWARAVLHPLMHRLGDVAAAGLRDPRELLAPLVESLIALRKELRSARSWELADRLRAELVAARIDLHDTPSGTLWELRPD